MPNYANGVYGPRPWTSPKPWVASDKAAYPPQAYIGPFASNQERLLTQSLEVGNMTHAEVQEYVRPNLPQIELFPDRYGFKTTEYGIRDIIEMTGRPVTRVDFAQQPTTTESTSRNALGTV
jgi:hypothetical protein